jgi:hypothetical protein
MCHKSEGLLLPERVQELYPSAGPWKYFNCGAAKEKEFTALTRNRAARDSHSKR